MMETRDKLQAIKFELNSLFIDREQEVRGLIWAALSRKHIELLGPPGNAKSAVARAICSRITGAEYFSLLMTADTSVDELIGPVDIRGLKEGVYRRITSHKMPEAHIVFLDEGYKATSETLNATLSIANERKIQNNGTEMSTPTIFIVLASNELPDGADNTSLLAFRDRMLLRFNIGWFTDESQLEAMIRLRGRHKQPPQTTVSLDELYQAHNEIDALELSQEAIDSLKLVFSRLEEEGIKSSPRRYDQVVDVMAAESWLCGSDVIVADSVLVAEHILWTKPDDIRLVSQIVRSSVNPNLAKAQEILAACKQEFQSLDDYTTRDELVEIIQKLHHMSKELETINTSAQIAQIKEQVDKMEQDAMDKMFSSMRRES